MSVPQASTSIKAYPLEADDWRLVRQPGSHRQFNHPSRPGRVTVAGNDGDEIKPGTLASFLRQAQLKGRGRDRIRGGHEGEEGSYSAWSPDLPGCVATGASLHEVEQRMREAIEFHLEGLRLDGSAIPRPSAVATVVIPVPAA